MRHYTNKTVLSDSMFVETGTFVPDVKESGHEVVNICDDDNVGAACAAHLSCHVGSPTTSCSPEQSQACIQQTYRMHTDHL